MTLTIRIFYNNNKLLTHFFLLKPCVCVWRKITKNMEKNQKLCIIEFFYRTALKYRLSSCTITNALSAHFFYFETFTIGLFGFLRAVIFEVFFFFCQLEFSHDKTSYFFISIYIRYYERILFSSHVCRSIVVSARVSYEEDIHCLYLPRLFRQNNIIRII